MHKIDYEDENGMKRRVILKNEYDNPSKGIPCDCYELLKEFYRDASTDFIQKLYSRLWEFGVIELQDFVKPENKSKVRQAINSTIASDATDLTRYVLAMESSS